MSKTYQSTIDLPDGRKLVAFSTDKQKAETQAKHAARAFVNWWEPLDRLTPSTKEVGLDFPEGYSTYAIVNAKKDA